MHTKFCWVVLFCEPLRINLFKNSVILAGGNMEKLIMLRLLRNLKHEIQTDLVKSYFWEIK